MTDETGFSIETKIDFGVHTRLDVEQSDRSFKIIVDDSKVSLLVNPNEQILVEKLKSLLRFGSATTRFKDIFDIYYLSRRVRRTAVKRLIKAYIFDDAMMRENDVPDILRRLGRIFGNKAFMRSLANPTSAWLDVSAAEATADIVAFMSSLG